MAAFREQMVGQITGPNGRPQNVNITTSTRPNISRAERDAGIEWVNTKYPEPGDLRRYGLDETTDWGPPLERAINVAAAGNGFVKIYKRIDNYEITTDATLSSISGEVRIFGVGNPTIEYTGSETGYVFQITDTNGHDVLLDGFTLDCGGLAATGIRVDNPSASMAAANIGRLHCRDLTINDPYLHTGQTQDAAGIVAVGGFSEVILDNINVNNVDRDTGAGVSGSRGCTGIQITFDDIDAYPQKCTVIGGHINVVTNNETTGNAADVDCDGIIYSVPTATANDDIHVPASIFLWGTKFTDCKGRCLKTQADGFSMVRDVTVVRGLEEAINDATDFDFQRGGGILDGVVYYANETAGSGTVWGTGHIVCRYGPDQLATDGDNKDGGFKARNIVIYNSIPAATDALPNVCFIDSGSSSRDVMSISLKDCAVVGGSCDRFVQVSNQGTSNDFNISVRDCEGVFTTNFVRFQDTVSTNVIVSITGNRDLGSAAVALVATNSGSPTASPTAANGYNTGFS